MVRPPGTRGPLSGQENGEAEISRAVPRIGKRRVPAVFIVEGEEMAEGVKERNAQTGWEIKWKTRKRRPLQSEDPRPAAVGSVPLAHDRVRAWGQFQ